MIEISVLIPTHNRLHFLQRNLPKLWEQRFPADAFEILVIVDGSTDGTAGWLKAQRSRCRMRIIEQPQSGELVADNAGIRAAHGRLVLFVDDDLECVPDLLKRHVEASGGREDAFVFGPVLVSPKSEPGVGAEFVRRHADEFFGGLTAGEQEWGWERTAGHANCSIPRSCLVKYGGFAPNFPYAFDAELGLRLHRHGIKAIYEPRALTWEVYSKSAETVTHREGLLRGVADVRLSRVYPEHRTACQLGRWAEGGILKRRVRQWAARHPKMPTAALRAASALVDRCVGVPGGARLAGSLGVARRGVASLRSAIDFSGGTRAFEKEFGRSLPVLLYHHVGIPADGAWPMLTIRPERFARHIEWMARWGYVGIRPSDWIAWRRNARSLPPKSVLITFDDAYADLAEFAFPILERYGFGAGVFAVSDRIGGSNDWDRRQGYPSRPLLTRAQMVDWSHRGIEFGSHGRKHDDLTRLDDASLIEELSVSREAISESVGTEIEAFAYPYGTNDERVRRKAADFYEIGFTMEGGLNLLCTDPLRLRRTLVRPKDGMVDLALRLKLGRSPLDGVRRRLAPFRDS